MFLACFLLSARDLRPSPRCSTDFDAWRPRGGCWSPVDSLSRSRKRWGMIELRHIIQLAAGRWRAAAAEGRGRGRQQHAGGRRCQKNLEFAGAAGAKARQENMGCSQKRDFDTEF